MRSLFPADLPEGFRYQDAFVGIDEEQELVRAIADIQFSTFEMHGVVARRRVAFFGRTYEDDQTKPIPDFLMPLRGRAARWAGVDPDAFVMALINEYRPGAPIGWHRDAPQYGLIAGISLLSRCRMRFRPYVRPAKQSVGRAPRRFTHEVWLEPRSAYVIDGLARSEYEHSIPAADALRYSITFRTHR
jgi:alkylated DNA repair dioxygenase AlkB